MYDIINAIKLKGVLFLWTNLPEITVTIVRLFQKEQAAFPR